MEMVTPPSSSAERVQTPPPSLGTGFGTQANALLRKNLTYQKRNYKTNCCLIFFPVLLILALVGLQAVVNSFLSGSEFKCGCKCVPNKETGDCVQTCGLAYSSASQSYYCPIKNPIEWPAFLQIPSPQYRATQTGKFSDLSNQSCRQDNSCPISLLYTGQNQSLSNAVMRFIFSPCSSSIGSTILDALSTSVVGTDSSTSYSNHIEPAILAYNNPLLILKTDCLNPALNTTNSTQLNLPSVEGSFPLRVGVGMVESFWHGNGTAINSVLYEGFLKGNPDRRINEISAAYDFGRTSLSSFDTTIWYNRSFRNDTSIESPGLARVSRSMNMVAKAFLRIRNGSNSELPLLFIKEMPKSESSLRLDLSSLLSPIFYMLVIQLLLPVILQQLVYEKENNLRIMMKMHGLGDGPYLLISYLYFLFISVVYLLCFVAIGSAAGQKIFTLTDYSLQIVFYFIYANLQVALGFLASTVFSSVKTSSGCSIPYVIGFSLLGYFLFQNFLEDQSFTRSAIFAMELLPGFSLYRGLYEFSSYAFVGNYQGTQGMQWSNVQDPQSGFRDILGIMVVEWVIFILLAYYLDQVVESGGGVKKSPIFFLDAIFRKKKQTLRQPSLRKKSQQMNIQMQRDDVEEERLRVEEAINGTSGPHTIICDDLRKVYPGRDGNPEKFAVRGLSLAIPTGECFGMLGPNGAGKTSSIDMMIGLSKPTSGTAFIDGLDICKDMDTIYTYMGVCPQHDLIWGTLTGIEHLLFYGRLKNLKGSALLSAVESSLKSVNLFNGGVGDRLAGKYSGGMKRRLSVAISLIGNPKVVYMDEPSTGLDPASRRNLWNVVKNVKRDRAIILTTHSMEEAETLCDRLGIFVDGQLQCIGTAREFKARYGGTYSLTISTPESEVEAVLKMVFELSPNAKQVYTLAGTQKFELPKAEVKITDVFKVVENAKSLLTIQAWGVADTTLEDVFIKVARETSSSNKLA